MPNFILLTLLQAVNNSLWVIYIDKTTYSIFHPPRKKIPSEYDSLFLGQTQIKWVECVRYLGLSLDDQLKWNNHINCLVQKSTNILCAFRLIKNLTPPKYKHQLYYGYCYSVISYDIQVYASTTSSGLGKFKDYKIRHGKFWTNELKLLQVREIYSLYLLKFVHKQQHSKLPEIFNNYFVTRERKHQINIRNKHNLHINIFKTSVGQKSIKVLAAHTCMFNELPLQIKELQSLKVFF